MAARSLSTQCLCIWHLEEAPVNNTLSDAFQEPAVSNMSVAMETATCLCSASHICVARALSFHSGAQPGGCPAAGSSGQGSRGSVAVQRGPGALIPSSCTQTWRGLQRVASWPRWALIAIFPPSSRAARLRPAPLQQRAP